MDLSSLPTPVLISLIAILIATAVGCIAALHSWTRISKEIEGVKKAETALTVDAAWEDAYPHDKLQLAAWLRAKGIKPDSHLGDFMRTSWSAWLGGRPASLTELHVLVARRERSYRSTRLSAGIAALLLVFGIVGTLSSIKPVLQDFQFSVAAESNPVAAGGDTETGGNNQQIGEQEPGRDADSVAANTDLVNSLIHNLGNAFWPSLLALIGTIIVVSSRGVYSLSLYKFTLELDRFAVDTLIPRYRVPSLSEQYQEVKATLASVTESLLHREGRFHEAVESLENLVGGIAPSLSGLEAAATDSKDASAALTSKATSITDSLNRHLGTESPIHRAIAGFENIFEKTEVSLGNLSLVIEGIGQSNTSTRKELETAVQTLSQSVGRIAENHQSHQSEATAALTEFKASMTGIPELIKNTNAKAIGNGMDTINSTVAQLATEQRKWHVDSTNELRTATKDGYALVTQASEDLVTQAKSVTSAAAELKKIGAGAKPAFDDLAKEGKSQIEKVATLAKSEIKSASAKMPNDPQSLGRQGRNNGRENQRTILPPPKNDSSNNRSANHGETIPADPEVRLDQRDVGPDRSFVEQEARGKKLWSAISKPFNKRRK